MISEIVDVVSSVALFLKHAKPRLLTQHVVADSSRDIVPIRRGDGVAEPYFVCCCLLLDAR
jgi:hypothetical protein